MGLKGKAKLLKIYCGETEKWQGKNLYHHIVLMLRKEGIEGVTVSRGILGYGTDKILHSAKILELSADLPMIIEAVDTEEKINKVLPVIQQVFPKGLIMLIDVYVVHNGTN